MAAQTLVDEAYANVQSTDDIVIQATDAGAGRYAKL